jgi:hypothetical protein
VTATAVALRERPILFSGPMVRALLSGQKTQTRRVVKPEWQGLPLDNPEYARRALESCPYGVADDRLWVRETHQIADARPELYEKAIADRPTEPWPAHVTYAADDDAIQSVVDIPPAEWRESFDVDHVRWRPSIHMPRWASRISLELTDVRVEPLQKIGEADAIAEGVEEYAKAALSQKNDDSPVDRYRYLWDSLNAKRGYGWDVNPWVWVLAFRRVA